MDTTTPDLAAVKQRQQLAWASSDFSVVAARIVLTAEHLCDTADSHALRWHPPAIVPGHAARSRILLVSGSLRAGSTNAAVVQTAAALHLPAIDAVAYNGLGRLPHFNPDDDFAPLPATVEELRAAIAGADAVLFCTPEYAGALPGSFKNLLDWTIGGEELYRKPVGWINAAAAGRGENAHDSLRKVLGFAHAEIVEAACMQVPVARDAVGEDGLIEDPGVRAAIGRALTDLASGAGAHGKPPTGS
jgi:NAD(P)H-dependent FMN reductase